MALAAVTLDAAGTLFEVAEPVGLTYARAAARHGLALGAEDAERRFRRAVAGAAPLAFPGIGAAQRAERERAWWREIVRAAFGSAAEGPGFEACFDELFGRYARPEAWRLFPEVREALLGLRGAGVRLAIVSNFDGRLAALARALGVAPLVDLVLPSSRAGAAKPEPAIFHAAVAALGVAPGAAVHVGDGVVADVEGARAAGLGAVLLDRNGRTPRPPAGVPTIATLSELLGLLGAAVA
jgi:putative hydrolase of the HAD superfamily